MVGVVFQVNAFAHYCCSRTVTLKMPPAAAAAAASQLNKTTKQHTWLFSPISEAGGRWEKYHDQNLGG